MTENQNLSPQALVIETALTRLEKTYQEVMLASHRTESELIAEFLIANAGEVLDMQAQARTLKPEEQKEWLGIISRRIDRLVYARRSR